MRKAIALIVSVWCIFTGVNAKDAGGKLEIKPLTENVWMHTSYRQLEGFGWFPSNGLIVIDGKRAILVDTAWTEEATKEIFLWIKGQGLRLDYLVVTHSHDDRTAGLAWLNTQGIETYASARTNQILATRGEETAKHDFPETGSLNGDLRIEIFYPGSGHTEDNHIVWIPDERILAGGCFVKSMESTALGNVADADIGEWGVSIERVMKRYPEPALVVPGHGEPGHEHLIAHTRALINAATD